MRMNASWDIIVEEVLDMNRQTSGKEKKRRRARGRGFYRRKRRTVGDFRWEGCGATLISKEKDGESVLQSIVWNQIARVDLGALESRSEVLVRPDRGDSESSNEWSIDPSS